MRRFFLQSLILLIVKYYSWFFVCVSQEEIIYGFYFQGYKVFYRDFKLVKDFGICLIKCIYKNFFFIIRFYKACYRIKVIEACWKSDYFVVVFGVFD